MKIDKDKLILPEPEPIVSKITVYEVKPKQNGSLQSFIITATNKIDTKTLGGSSSQQSHHSKEASGSSDERGTATLA